MISQFDLPGRPQPGRLARPEEGPGCGSAVRGKAIAAATELPSLLGPALSTSPPISYSTALHPIEIIAAEDAQFAHKLGSGGATRITRQGHQGESA